MPDCQALKQAVSKPVFTPGKWEWELEYTEECIKKGVDLIAGAKYEGINDQGLIITTETGLKRTLETESILPVIALQADHNLAKELEGIVPEVRICGSCNRPGLIRDAINEGNQIGMAL